MNQTFDRFYCLHFGIDLINFYLSLVSTFKHFILLNSFVSAGLKFAMRAALIAFGQLICFDSPVG